MAAQYLTNRKSNYFSGMSQNIYMQFFKKMLGKYNAGYRYKLVITLLDKKYIVDQLYAQICSLLYRKPINIML